MANRTATSVVEQLTKHFFSKGLLTKPQIQHLVDHGYLTKQDLAQYEKSHPQLVEGIKRPKGSFEGLVQIEDLASYARQGVMGDADFTDLLVKILKESRRGLITITEELPTLPAHYQQLAQKIIKVFTAAPPGEELLSADDVKALTYNAAQKAFLDHREAALVNDPPKAIVLNRSSYDVIRETLKSVQDLLGKLPHSEATAQKVWDLTTKEFEATLKQGWFTEDVAAIAFYMKRYPVSASWLYSKATNPEYNEILVKYTPLSQNNPKTATRASTSNRRATAVVDQLAKHFLDKGQLDPDYVQHLLDHKYITDDDLTRYSNLYPAMVKGVKRTRDYVMNISHPDTLVQGYNEGIIRDKHFTEALTQMVQRAENLKEIHRLVPTIKEPGRSAAKALLSALHKSLNSRGSVGHINELDVYQKLAIKQASTKFLRPLIQKDPSAAVLLSAYHHRWDTWASDTLDGEFGSTATEDITPAALKAAAPEAVEKAAAFLLKSYAEQYQIVEGIRKKNGLTYEQLKDAYTNKNSEKWQALFQKTFGDRKSARRTATTVTNQLALHFLKKGQLDTNQIQHLYNHGFIPQKDMVSLQHTHPHLVAGVQLEAPNLEQALMSTLAAMTKSRIVPDQQIMKELARRLETQPSTFNAIHNNKGAFRHDLASHLETLLDVARRNIPENHLMGMNDLVDHHTNPTQRAQHNTALQIQAELKQTNPALYVYNTGKNAYWLHDEHPADEDEQTTTAKAEERMKAELLTEPQRDKDYPLLKQLIQERGLKTDQAMAIWHSPTRAKVLKSMLEQGRTSTRTATAVVDQLARYFAEKGKLTPPQLQHMLDHNFITFKDADALIEFVTKVGPLTKGVHLPPATTADLSVSDLSTVSKHGMLDPKAVVPQVVAALGNAKYAEALLTLNANLKYFSPSDQDRLRPVIRTLQKAHDKEEKVLLRVRSMIKAELKRATPTLKKTNPGFIITYEQRGGDTPIKNYERDILNSLAKGDLEAPASKLKVEIRLAIQSVAEHYDMHGRSVPILNDAIKEGIFTYDEAAIVCRDSNGDDRIVLKQYQGAKLSKFGPNGPPKKASRQATAVVDQLARYFAEKGKLTPPQIQHLLDHGFISFKDGKEAHEWFLTHSEKLDGVYLPKREVEKLNTVEELFDTTAEGGVRTPDLVDRLAEIAGSSSDPYSTLHTIQSNLHKLNAEDTAAIQPVIRAVHSVQMKLDKNANDILDAVDDAVKQRLKDLETTNPGLSVVAEHVHGRGALIDTFIRDHIPHNLITNPDPAAIKAWTEALADKQIGYEEPNPLVISINELVRHKLITVERAREIYRENNGNVVRIHRILDAIQEGKDPDTLT